MLICFVCGCGLFRCWCRWVMFLCSWLVLVLLVGSFCNFVLNWLIMFSRCWWLNVGVCMGLFMDFFLVMDWFYYRCIVFGLVKKVLGFCLVLKLVVWVWLWGISFGSVVCGLCFVILVVVFVWCFLCCVC